MNKVVLFVVLGFFAFLIACAGWLAFTYIHYANMGNRLEVALLAKHKNLENVMSSGHQQISGVAQAAGMMKDDLKEVFTAAITAREGVDGSRAIFKMVQEHNPNVDTSLYKEITVVVKSTKQELQNNQTAFLTQKGQYEEMLGRVWEGFWLKLAGYPKTDLSALKIATTTDAQESYKTGVDKAIKLR